MTNKKGENEGFLHLAPSICFLAYSVSRNYNYGLQSPGRVLIVVLIRPPVLVRLSTVISVLFAHAVGKMAANQQLTGKAHQLLVNHLLIGLVINTRSYA